MNRTLCRLGRTAALIAVSSLLASAQGTQTASLSGVVVDRNGKPVAGARVELSSPHLQGRREVLSDETGRFITRLLPPGQYHIVVSKAGFYTAPLDAHLGLEQTFSPRIVLAPVSTATVEVIASLSGVDKTETKSALNYTSDQIDALPVNRGTALDIAYLSPGVTKNANSDKGNVEIRGASGQGNLTLVDGQNVMDNVYSGQRVKIIFDAVDETQVMTGAIPAEYGYIEGGVINQITKVGGNEFSGSIRFDMQNPGWDAANPLTDRTSLGNAMSQSESVTLGGPIIKDKLWFFGAYYSNKPFLVNAFYGVGQSGNPSKTWVSNETDMRREMKLTWSPGTDHTFTATYNNNSDGWLRDAGGAGELAAESNFLSTGNFWSLGYRGILTPNLTLNVRYGKKNQVLGAHTSDNPLDYTHGVPVFAEETTGAYFGAPIWDPNDPQPDTRNNETATVKVTHFWTAMGSHETDYGFDYYLGTTRSSGYQAGGRITIPGFNNGQPMDFAGLNVSDYSLAPGTAQMAAIYDSEGLYDFAINTQVYVPDQLKVATTGLYVNDKWTLDNHLMFNIGLRYDSYKATADSVGNIASSHVFSPRLGLKYDVWGDSKLVGGLSYSVLQGRMQESQLQAATYVFHPISYTFYGNYANIPATWITPAGNPTYNVPIQALFAGIFAPGNPFLDTNPADVGQSNAVVANKFNPGLKPPQVEESQASLAYNFQSELFGKGFLRLVGVRKIWSKIVDTEVGAPGQTHDQFGNVLDINYWTNQPAARRDYKSLELDGQTTLGQVQIQGNITWSALYGNGTGEALSNPAIPYGIQAYNVDPATQATLFNTNLTAPYGRLVTLGSPSPLVIHGIFSYSHENVFGKINYGVTYRFSSGAHYDNARTFNLSALPALANDPNVGSYVYNYGAPSEYMNGQRGNGVFSGTSYTDLSIQQDFNAFKVGGGTVVAFLKATFYNVWNHQQQASWDVSYATNSSGVIGPLAPAWQGNTGFGTADSASNYGDPRTVQLSAGFRF